MKTRSGFVSNSSSSSFIVLLDDRPKNVKHLQQLIFTQSNKMYYKEETWPLREIEKYIYDPYKVDKDKYEEGVNMFSTKDAAKYLGIPKDEHVCQLTKRNTRKATVFLAEALMSGKVEDRLLELGYPEFPDTNYDTIGDWKESEKKWSAYRKQERTWALAHARHIIPFLTEKYPGSYLCTFKASDNDSRLGATIEHGDTFQYCKFWLRFSNH